MEESIIMIVKVASTREIIRKLQDYEKENGIGAVIGIATVGNGNRTIEYKLMVANDSNYNKIHKKDGKYKETEIEISSINDLELFECK